MKLRTILYAASLLVTPSALGQTLLGGGSASGASDFGSAAAQFADYDGDGTPEVAVGAFNHSLGLVLVLRGSVLASGGGASAVIAHNNTDATMRSMGYSLLSVDINGDGGRDLVMGAGYPFSNYPGAVRVMGSTGNVFAAIKGVGSEALGAALADAGDRNGDGYRDVLAGAPRWGTSSASPDIGRAYLLSGRALMGQGGAAILHIFQGVESNSWFGFSVASLDVNLDGVLELAIAAPKENTLFSIDVGAVRVFSGLTNAQMSWFRGSQANQQVGNRLARAGDIDGDGIDDLVSRAAEADFQGFIDVGTVTAYSGADLATLPSSVPTLATWGWPSAVANFGRTLAGGTDVTGDGVADVIVGSANPQAHWQIISGATREFVAGNVNPASTLLSAVVPIDDMNGDGVGDIVLGDETLNGGFGAAELYTAFPAAPVVYCTSKTNSLGCQPSMSSTGFASASASTTFNVFASSLLNQKSGLLFYGSSSNADPFQGGYLCVAQPVRRTLLQNSGGASSGNSCTGSIALDFNAHVQGGADPSLAAGSEVYVQCWSRDPTSSFGTNLTNALRFLIGT